MNFTCAFFLFLKHDYLKILNYLYGFYYMFAGAVLLGLQSYCLAVGGHRNWYRDEL